MSRAGRERLIQQVPDLEARYGAVRGFMEPEGIVYVAKASAPDGRPLTQDEVRELGMALHGIGLENKEILEPLYNTAVLTEEHPLKAWKKAAETRALSYVEEVGRSEDIVFSRRVLAAVNTVEAELHNAFSFNGSTSPRFVVRKGTVEFEGRAIEVRGVCPFVRQALSIMQTAYDLMGVPIELPPAHVGLFLPSSDLFRRFP